VTALVGSRAQILRFRRRVGALDQRLPEGAESLRALAVAGLQDSMPRAALLSIHARMEGTAPTTWEDPTLVQVWGPRFSAYVVPADEHAPFTVGRLPDDGPKRELAEDLAHRLGSLLDGGRMAYGAAGRALGEPPNRLRYAAPTGTILIRWDGARQPEVWTVPPPDVEPTDALVDLARRYLHVFGPATASSFAGWAGVPPARGRRAFEMLQSSLVRVSTPIGEAWILADDESVLREPGGEAARARLLPSGDAYFLLWGADRELLIDDAAHRDALWTSRVWPGAMLAHGEIVGVWRRTKGEVRLQPWTRLSGTDRAALESEAASMPLPGVDTDIVIRWEE
jgi:DNA glycosylase AlkZ-like